MYACVYTIYLYISLTRPRRQNATKNRMLARRTLLETRMVLKNTTIPCACVLTIYVSLSLSIYIYIYRERKGFQRSRSKSKFVTRAKPG